MLDGEYYCLRCKCNQFDNSDRCAACVTNGFKDFESIYEEALKMVPEELREYAEQRIRESGIRMVSGHYPVFKSKEEVELWFKMAKFLSEKGREKKEGK